MEEPAVVLNRTEGEWTDCATCRTLAAKLRELSGHAARHVFESPCAVRDEGLRDTDFEAWTLLNKLGVPDEVNRIKAAAPAAGRGE